MIQCSRCLKQQAVMEIDRQWLCAHCYKKKTGRCPVCRGTDCAYMEEKNV